MKATLIWPCFDYGFPGGAEEPLGLLYITSVLKSLGVDVSYLDLVGMKDPSACAAASDSDIVGISAPTPFFGRAREVLNYVKGVNSKALYVLGGPHATVLPEDSLDAGFDIAMIGEGEGTISNLVSAFQSGDVFSIEGIAHKKNGTFHMNKRLPFIEDLDTIPFPWREKVNYDLYRTIGMFGSRGCPYKCAFCKPTQDMLFGARIRKRSVMNVVDEVEECLRTIGQRRITFKDDTLTLYPKEWFQEFHELTSKRKLKPVWTCNTSVRSANFEKLKIMKKAGCVQMCIGVESGSQRVLDFYNKSQTPEEVIRLFQWCRKVNIRTYALLMVGAPIETAEDLKKTYNLVKKLKPSNGQVYTVTPFPGTNLYNYALELGNMKQMGYEDYDTAMNTETWQSPFQFDDLSIEDLRKYTAKIISFIARRLLIRSLFSFGTWQEFVSSQAFRDRAKVVSRRYVASFLPMIRRKRTRASQIESPPRTPGSPQD